MKNKSFSVKNENSLGIEWIMRLSVYIDGDTREMPAWGREIMPWIQRHWPLEMKPALVRICVASGDGDAQQEGAEEGEQRAPHLKPKHHGTGDAANISSPIPGDKLADCESFRPCTHSPSKILTCFADNSASNFCMINYIYCKTWPKKIWLSYFRRAGDIFLCQNLPFLHPPLVCSQTFWHFFMRLFMG